MPTAEPPRLAAPWPSLVIGAQAALLYSDVVEPPFGPTECRVHLLDATALTTSEHLLGECAEAAEVAFWGEVPMAAIAAGWAAIGRSRRRRCRDLLCPEGLTVPNQNGIFLQSVATKPELEMGARSSVVLTRAVS